MSKDGDVNNRSAEECGGAAPHYFPALPVIDCFDKAHIRNANGGAKNPWLHHH
jgi:hypothetical protein